MSIRTLVASCALLALLSPFAGAMTKRSQIPKSARYKNTTGAKHFKYKSPKKQKRKTPKH